MRLFELRSLKGLLLAHELAFLFLVIVAGALGGTWAYFWQKNSAELFRLNQLTYSSLQIRSDLFRQIKEVTYARLTENTDALALYGDYSRQIDRHFNTLRQLAAAPDENAAVQAMQQAYRVLQSDMNNIFSDPYLISRVVPIRILDLQYEQTLVGDFEVALRRFEQILRAKQKRLDATLATWTRYAPILVPLPILVAIALIVAARRWLRRGFVQPMAAVMSGARLISKGDLNHVIPRGGVQEMTDLEEAINQMAVDLARSRDALVESEKSSALGALIPVVAHNIRNPLASIRASAQLLDHADQPQDIGDIRKAIIDTVDRLGRWVSALVSYLHPLKPQPVRRNLTVLLEAAVSLLQDRLGEKGVRVERGEWDTSTQVRVDPDLMEQALYALVSNAIDASPAGGTVTLAASGRGEEFLLSISDEGPGLPFQPQPTGLTPGPSTKRFGTGLGIPVAFKVCKAHGWKLKFERGDNCGTRVIITAPVTIEEKVTEHA
ncbi:MAG: ATP-binding protein [Chromatiales bacterium]